MIQVVYAKSRRVYGSPRVHGELLALDYRCSVTFVANMIRFAGISARMDW